MKMPKILKCIVRDCAYNANNKCHTIAITVGGPLPCCDTFMDSPHKGGFPDITGGVGACKVEKCQYNDRLECVVDSIEVGTQSCKADCMTFKRK